MNSGPQLDPTNGPTDGTNPFPPTPTPEGRRPLAVRTGTVHAASSTRLSSLSGSGLPQQNLEGKPFYGHDDERTCSPLICLVPFIFWQMLNKGPSTFLRISSHWAATRRRSFRSHCCFKVVALCGSCSESMVLWRAQGPLIKKMRRCREHLGEQGEPL